MKNRILIIEDEPTMRLGIGHFLTTLGYSVTLAEDGAKGMSLIEKDSFDLVVSDLRLPFRDGLEILKRTKLICPDTGVILMTAYADVKTAVQAIKDGAFDYLSKPFSNDEFIITIERFLKFRNLEKELSRFRKSVGENVAFNNIIGISSLMKDMFDRIASVAKTDVPVLIHGESGTGKELVANAIHELSNRKNMPFVKINCAAIPENLFESELFGHEKGAFTGAGDLRKGKFEFADSGAIFFDEIGDIPISLQPKLLRVIEDGVITRIGGNSTLKVDVRGIYATSRNLKESVAEGIFRSDLFYRINVIPIEIPPLRKRKEDIPYLLDHFMHFFKNKYEKLNLSISQPAYNAIISYDYPGNVREMKHAIERGVVLAKDGFIDIKNLPDEISNLSDSNLCIEKDISLEASLMCFEKQRILKTLKESGGRKIETANRLGISRKVLWKKMKEYSIE